MSYPHRPWISISMDFTGPFRKSNCFDMILVLIDRFTTFTYLFPCNSTITAPETAKLLQDRITATHGQPESILTDADPRFTSHFWQKLMKNLSIDHIMSTPYHHQTNGQVERRIRTVQQCLRNFVNRGHTDWSKYLGQIQHAINIAPTTSTGMSPYFLCFGYSPPVFESFKPRPTSVPGADKVATEVAAASRDAIFAMNYARFHQNAKASKHRRLVVDLQVGVDQVLVNSKPYRREKDRSQKLLPRSLGPFNILDKNTDLENYQIE